MQFFSYKHILSHWSSSEEYFLRVNEYWVFLRLRGTMSDYRYNPAWNKLTAYEEYDEKIYRFQMMCSGTIFVIPFEWVQRFYFEFYEHNFKIKPRLMNEKFCACHKYINNDDVVLYNHHYYFGIRWASTVKLNKMRPEQIALFNDSDNFDLCIHEKLNIFLFYACTVDRVKSS